MAFKPFVLKHCDLIIGDGVDAPNFKCQVRGAQLTPSVNVIRTKTACPEGQYADMDDPEWALDLKYLYGTDDGVGDPADVLAAYLLEHMGEDQPFTLRPKAGDAGYEGTIKVVPGVIGGDYGSFSEQSVSLPLLGQPTPVAAPVGP